MSQILYAGKLSEVEILRMEPFVSENTKVVGCWKLWLADGTETVLPEEELLRNNIQLTIGAEAEAASTVEVVSEVVEEFKTEEVKGDAVVTTAVDQETAVL